MSDQTQEEKIVEILEEGEPAQKLTQESTEKLFPCGMCGLKDAPGSHINECPYMTRSVLDIFTESLPEELINLFSLEDNSSVITVGAAKVIVQSILARQEKINSVFQLRLAKLAARAVGAGTPEEPTMWSNV